MNFDGQPPYIDPRRRPKGCQMDGLVIHDSFDVKMPSTTDYAVVQCKHEQLYLDVLTCTNQFVCSPTEIVCSDQTVEISAETYP